MWISLFSLIVLIVFLLYLLVMILITIGWYGLDRSSLVYCHARERITVVLAARNEENSISRLLKSLEYQRYPKSLFEVIIVDDHSTDNTKQVVLDFINLSTELVVKIIPAVGQGKKSALQLGVLQSTSRLIAVTDADCILPVNWIHALVNAFEEHPVSVLLAPVVYESRSGIFQHFFALEFFSLVGSGAGAAGIHLPFMGNGANMAFTREAFESATKDINYQQYASGDDVFLIHHAVKKFGRKSVGFLLHGDALVETPSPGSLKEFIRQRLRWASKAKGYRSPEAIVVSLVVLLTNCLLVLLFLAGFWVNWLWMIYVLLLITKILIDMPVVFGYASFAQHNELKKWFFPFSILYPFYIAGVGLASAFVTIKWKGRRYSK